MLDALTIGYADGQLTKVQHEERVSSVLNASIVDELRTSLRDLQLPSDHPAGALFGPSIAVRSRRVLGNVLVVLGLCFALVMGLVVFFLFRDERPDASAVPVAMLDQSALEQLVERVDDRFGTTEVLVAEVSAARVDLRFAAAGGAGRYETWSWDGHEFTPSTNGTLRTAHPGSVDLARLDVERLVANVDRTTGMLRGGGPAEVHVTVSGGAWPTLLNVHREVGARGPVQVEIAARGREPADSAHLVTDPTGRRVLLRLPSHYRRVS